MRTYAKLGLVGIAALLVGLDLALVDRLEGNRQIPVPQLDTDKLGQATVSVVCSQCPSLPEPAPRDALLRYEQVDAMVKQAIRQDDSERRLEEVVQPGDWVAVKVNIVTMPLVVNGRKQTSFWDQDTPHWGQVTDLRVVKSLIDYLVNQERDASRITLVEGGAEWNKVGEPGTDPAQQEDGWTVKWEPFAGLSYADIVNEFNGVNGIRVDIVDLNYDDWVGTEGVRQGDPLPVPDPNHTGIGGYQRPGYYVSRTLLEVDKLINVAAMKTHDIPGVTLLHKNYVGTYMQRAYGDQGNLKMGLHRYLSGLGNEQVPPGFVDLFSYRPTDYGLVEGFWGTEGRGPQWGDNVNHNVVVAGGDPVAVDAVAASIMGYNPEDLWYLKFSAAKGFGTYDLEHIRLVGDSIEEVQRNFAKTPQPRFWGWGNRAWLVNGPHPAEDLDSAPLEDEGLLRPVEGEENGGLAWKKVEGFERFVTLPEEYAAARSATYAFAYIKSAREQEGYLYLGADDGARVWLNGQEVLARPRLQKTPDAAKVPVRLGAGLNPVVVKVLNVYGGAGLSLVAGDQDGDTLPGIEYLLAPPADPTAVEENQESRPAGFSLEQNYPNPFNAETIIPYSLPGRSQVELAIYDARGARVRTLVDQVLPGGAHRTRWDGRDQRGAPVASGVYFYRLAMPGAGQTGRMALVR